MLRSPVTPAVEAATWLPRQTGLRGIGGGVAAAIRHSYSVPVTANNGTGNFPPFAAFASNTRRSLVVQLAADAPGSAQVGTILSQTANNLTIDNFTLNNVLQTLAVGEEYYDINGQGALFVRANASSIPAGLKVRAFVEHATTVGSGGTPSTGKRALIASTARRHQITNPVYTTNGPLGLLKDRTTYWRANPSNTKQLQISTNFATSPGSPTWTTIATMPNLVFSGGESQPAKVLGLVELDDGEALLYCGYERYLAAVFRSSGWSANKVTATWSKKLQVENNSNTKTFYEHYTATPFTHGNGIVMVPENGRQTNGTNDATLAAINLYVSADGALTFPYTFNLRDFAIARGFANPLGIHFHSAAYYAADDTAFACIGDRFTGAGDDVAGAGNILLLVCHGLKAAILAGQTPIWEFVPATENFTSTSLGVLQFIHAVPTDSGVILTPDVGRPEGTMMFLRRTGYRTYGAMIPLPGLGKEGMVDAAPTLFGGHYNFPGTIDYDQAAGTYNVPVISTPDLVEFEQFTIPQVLTATGHVGIRRIIGPDVNNKVVVPYIATAAQMSGGNFMVGDWVFA